MSVPDPIEDALYERQARLCQVLADPKRLRLVGMLRDNEHSVGELAEALGVAYPNVSQHLNVMRDAGLVATRRSGTSVFYRLGLPAHRRGLRTVREVLREQLVDAAELAGR